MRVAIPHQLPKEEVRQRLHARAHEIGDQVGGMAQVTTSWETEDRLAMTITAMGQDMLGSIDNEEGELVFEFDLPPALGFVRNFIESAIREKGQKLLT
jgi:hypothetical protein